MSHKMYHKIYTTLYIHNYVFVLTDSHLINAYQTMVGIIILQTFSFTLELTMT